MAKTWEHTEIEIENGTKVRAIAPLIISASRATDIPAFHAGWFIDRIKKGYVQWTNPFNRIEPVYVSLKNARAIVFWTKNPKPLMPYLSELDTKGINYYFQFTVNDYETEDLEPGVPKLEERIKTFIELSDKIGKEKVIWRFDPLILLPGFSAKTLLDKVLAVGKRLAGHTDKLVFSFADISAYRKVTNNLLKTGLFSKSSIDRAEFSREDRIAFAAGLQDMINDLRKINPEFSASTCTEDIDLESFGIAHNRCIDDELMIKLFKEDHVLMEFLGYSPLLGSTGLKLKDKGQRKACGCIMSKDIGSYNTCSHFCAYCYANTSRQEVERNIQSVSRYEAEDGIEKLKGKEVI